MGDPLSISASIAAILQLTSTVVIYLQDIKDASQDRQRILTEVTSATGLLYCLKDLADREQERSPSTSAARLLAVEDGPLSQFKQALERLSSKLAPVTGLKKAEKTLMWPFQKREISDILYIIERQKTYFMLALQNKDLELAQAIKDGVAHLHSKIDGLGRQLNEIKLDARSKDVIQWLKPVDPSTNHNLARKKHQPTTGAWLLGQQPYQDWKTSNGGLLWMNGKVGCGKTILCSTAIEDILVHCRTRTQYSACYYYFDFHDAEKTRHETLIRTILHHMALQSPDCLKLLHSLCQRCQDGSQQPTHTQLLETLQAMLEMRPSAYIVIDALDECVDREDLLSLIKQILDWKGGVHVFATSRKERDIEEALSVCAIYQTDLKNVDVDVDIRLHVRRQIQDDPRLAAWPLQIQQEIEQTLGSRANGMFRWAVCQLDAIRKCVKLDTLRKTLSNLPRTLEDTYQRILCSIDEEYVDDALKILQWLTFSARPMLLDEIAEVVAIDLTKDPKYDDARRLRRPQDVVSICSSLVVVSSVQLQALNRYYYSDNMNSQPEEPVLTDMIALAHLSVKDYLTSTKIVSTSAAPFQISERSAHLCLAQMCLSYLVENGPKVNDVSLVDYPLSRYAAEFWIQHATAADDESLDALIMNTFTSSKSFLLCWVRLYKPDLALYERSELDFSRSEESIGSPLYYASYCGLLGTVERLLASGADVDGKGGKFTNALTAASCQGHDKIVLKLLHNGATENTDVEPRKTAMFAATRARHTSTVRLLLMHSHMVTKDQLNHCLIEAAIEAADELALLLLQSGADINFVDSKFGTPLHMAAGRRNKLMVRLLLEHGADVNACGGVFGAALIAAAYWGDADIIAILLARGAQVNFIGAGYHGTALHVASRYGHTKVIELLLDHSADVNAVGGMFGAALIAAAFWGDADIVAILLARGAQVNSIGADNNGTALHVASRYGHTKVIELLLDHGADVNAVGGMFGAALIAAAFWGDADIVAILLARGAQVNSIGADNNRTALHVASRYGHIKVIELLLDHGADVNAVRGYFGSALIEAVLRGKGDIVTILLAQGVDTIYSHTASGTALEIARHMGRNKVVQIFDFMRHSRDPDE